MSTGASENVADIFNHELTMYPMVICGRRVWVSNTGRHRGGAMQIWIHKHPKENADIYLKGVALLQGTIEENVEFLESICRERWGG